MVPAGYEDRIVVRNLANNQVLIDTSVLVTPAAAAGQWLNPGEHQDRTFRLRLPDGLRGVGDIQIAVTANQTSAGIAVLYETNISNTADVNNAVTANFVSTEALYAALHPTAFNLPATYVSLVVETGKD